MRSRLGVDLSLFREPVTGVGHYAIGLLDALTRERPGALSLRTYRRGEWVDAPLPASSDEDGTSEDASPRPAAPALGTPAAALISAFDRFPPLADFWGAIARARFRQASRERPVDLFYALNFLPPDDRPLPFVSVVHDLSHLRHPDTHPASRRRWLARLPASLRRAAAVQAVSAFTASEMEALLGIPPERIAIVPPIVSPLFFSEPSSRPLSRHGLQHGAYILSVGTREPRKNLGTIIAAYAALPASVRARMPLVIVGPQGWGREPGNGIWDRLASEGSLKPLGYVSRPELRDLYAGAGLLAYASLYEGFGMPVAEASATGAPVAVSQCPALLEAAGPGEGVHRAEALDIDAWRAIFAALDRGERRMRPVADRVAAARRFEAGTVGVHAAKLLDGVLAEIHPAAL